MQISRTVSTTASLEQAFAYLADFTTTNQWDPGTVRTTRLSGDGGVGTRYRNVSRFLGRETELDYVVTALEPGRLLRLRGENASVASEDEMRFATEAGRTTVTYRATLRLKGFRVLTAPVVALAFRRLAHEAENGLRTALSRLVSP
jgi:hypothetical protein